MKKILTIQDISCYGSCSTTVALPILNHYGLECAILPSAILSTHTGGFTNYHVIDLTLEMEKIVNHWVSENITFDCFYTGYIASSLQFKIITEAITKLKKDNCTIYVDPAMADKGLLYKGLDESIVLGHKELIKKANVIFPNITETCLLLNKEYKTNYTLDEIKDMAKELAILGPNLVIITGVENNNQIGSLAYNKNSNEFITSFITKEEKSYHGTGDLYTSLIISYLENNYSIKEALDNSTAFISKAIKETLSDKSHFYGVKYEQVLQKETFLRKKEKKS